MGKRIEFIERFYEITEEQQEAAEKMGTPVDRVAKYRRVYVNLLDIFAPKELPGKKAHSQIEFYDGCTIIVKGSYDTICQQIDDREAQFYDDLVIEE